ncbi:DUF5634 family protein [Litchfieldia alkalitelluris]|uniref:DUF5634 family protein n=1 Tax=Litchfieldia alkalitelluris TaxID=304268 RepID=UPI0009975721|nr:DUF5634 family protein [Litchfieldia alkalitelluris]
MEFQSREEVIRDLQKQMPSIMDEFDVEEIGVYEEEGEGNHYYMGYTVRKNGHVYMINTPYVKNDKKELTQAEETWTIQEEEGESKGYRSLNEVFQKINEKTLH